MLACLWPSESDMKDDHCTCTVEVSPEEVDAGADITLTVRVAGLRKGKPIVSIRDQHDAELACVELAKSDDGEYESDDIVLPAPRTVGEHAFRAVVLTADKDGNLHEQAGGDTRVVVQPHSAQLNVWEVPSAIVAGERFRFTVGIRCSAGCHLGGEAFSIIDGTGAQVGTADLGPEVWPSTEALYFAEVEADAPPTAGNHEWGIRTAAWNCELPHDAGSIAVALRVVSPPDCEVTIEVFDRENQTPIKGARVLLHPYRAVTDENGVAKVKVTKGRHDILVSASKYMASGTTVEVTADMPTRAELDKEPPVEPEDEVPGY